jgi:hypothetical protein
MDAANLKKLQDYAAYLAKQAEKEEDDGKTSEATKSYLKLIDVLLLLGRESKDQQTFLRYTSSAEFYQKKVKGLITVSQSSAATQPGRIQPKQSDVQTHDERRDAQKPSLGVSLQPIQKVESERSANGGGSISSQATSGAKTNPFRRILGSFQTKNDQLRDEESQKGEQEGEGKASTSQARQTTLSKDTEIGVSSAISKSQGNGEVAQAPESASNETRMLASAQEEEPTKKNYYEESRDNQPTKTPSNSQSDVAAYSKYENLLSENKELQERIDFLKQKVSSLEKENRDLAERLGRMVSRAEYEELKRQLSESVPRNLYENLQKTCAETMVPRELYVEAEKRASKLEEKLENSYPASVLDKLANDISFIIATAEIPLGSDLVDGQSASKQRAESAKI